MVAVQSVAIIGAGISGLVTASAMQQRGYSVTVFEKEVNIGESWRRSIFYIGEVAQTVRKDYTFYGSGLPPLSSEWPGGEEMQQYLRLYALKTGVYQFISFHTTVRKIHFDTNSWKISAWKQDDNCYLEQQFDAVVVCTGFESGSYSCVDAGTTIQFKEPYINTMLDNRTSWPLYRNIAVSDSSRIGFVGMHGGLYFSLTATIAAHWMAAYLSGGIPPSLTPIPMENHFKRYNKKSQLSLLIRYLNRLLKDMGGKPLASTSAVVRLLGIPFMPEAYGVASNKLINSPDALLDNVGAGQHAKSGRTKTIALNYKRI